MTPTEFIQRVSFQLADECRIGAPLAEAELEDWIARFPRSAIPEDYVGFLRRANGVQVWVVETRDE